ncbi:hypothetical protein DRW41_04615 [Neobacillus piezotolerans]|uniref:Uncharacterized protein n=1 Tax=Neobacillus piezotolerans TaxID=2259171 RepID=A0A3D8GWM8_9BACI|nr:hypothetical protein [Neobacillus piezotolerans]RDU38845.1 hypothetical protein DRW41_04615 [Neobacillus piezotolerans]
MDYKYDFSIKQVGKWRMFRFSEENSLIEYMFDDMQSFSSPIFYEYFNKVLDGSSEKESIGGNMVYLEIGKNFTNIGLGFTDEVQAECFNTVDLKSIIMKWIDLNKELFR